MKGVHKMVFKKISFAQANWDKDINDNFANVVHDTNWQKLDLLAPATGTMNFRVFNSILYFSGAIVPGFIDTQKVGFLPVVNGLDNKNFIAKDMKSGNPISIRIDTDYSVNIKSESDVNYISFDGIAIFVGDITDLGG